MANEVTISVSLAFSKGGVTDSLSFQDLQFDVSGTKMIHHVQSVTTGVMAIDKGNITTPGWIIGINRDDTNYVDIIGVTAETATVKIEAGEPFMFRLSGTAPEFQANTSACTVEYLLIED